eukprot:1252009-Ditylum_brightwellii.AAC.1
MIRSYHGTNGKIIPRCHQADRTLKLWDAQMNETRRPSGITYVKVACDINFSALNAANTEVYPYMFFMRLPTETRTVTNTVGAEVSLSTFFRPHDWEQSTDQTVVDSIWNSTASLRKLFLLKHPVIQEAHADTIIDFDTARQQLTDLCLTASWEDIANKAYKQLCPHFVHDPASVIQGIHQTYMSHTDGTKVIQTVEEYHKGILQMTNFLPRKQNWGLDVTQHFMTHL